MISDVDAGRLAEIALDLAARIRFDPPDVNAAWLAETCPDPADWFRLSFLLAAILPIDLPWSALAGWVRARSIPNGDRS